MSGLERVAMEVESDLHVQGVGSVFGISFNRSGEEITNYRDHAINCDEQRYTLFAGKMMNEGIRLSSNGRVHLSSAHTDDQIDATIASASRVLASM